MFSLSGASVPRFQKPRIIKAEPSPLNIHFGVIFKKTHSTPKRRTLYQLYKKAQDQPGDRFQNLFSPREKTLYYWSKHPKNRINYFKDLANAVRRWKENNSPVTKSKNDHKIIRKIIKYSFLVSLGTSLSEKLKLLLQAGLPLTHIHWKSQKDKREMTLLFKHYQNDSKSGIPLPERKEFEKEFHKCVHLLLKAHGYSNSELFTQAKQLCAEYKLKQAQQNRLLNYITLQIATDSETVRSGMSISESDVTTSNLSVSEMSVSDDAELSKMLATTSL